MSQSPPGTGNCLLDVYSLYTGGVATGKGNKCHFNEEETKIFYILLWCDILKIFMKSLHRSNTHHACPDSLAFPCWTGVEMLFFVKLQPDKKTKYLIVFINLHTISIIQIPTLLNNKQACQLAGKWFPNIAFNKRMNCAHTQTPACHKQNGVATVEQSQTIQTKPVSFEQQIIVPANWDQCFLVHNFVVLNWSTNGYPNVQIALKRGITVTVPEQECKHIHSQEI